METMLIENGGNAQRVYESLLVEPGSLSIFSSGLALKMIAELSKKPACAMDIARKLGEHEQKIYYHLRKMKAAGIVRLERSEPRYGMTAKIYSLASPVVSSKLVDSAYKAAAPPGVKNQRFLDLMHPFVKDGALNAKVIIGDTYAHGRFDAASTEGPHTFDFAMLLGNHLDSLSFPLYKLDTEVTERELKENLVLFGNPRTNMVIDRVNRQHVKYFTDSDGVISFDRSKVYDRPLIGVVIKDKNPFNKNKKIMIIGGKGRRGLKTAVIAITRYMEQLMTNHEKTDDFVRIVEGLDRTGDQRIDTAKILE